MTVSVCVSIPVRVCVVLQTYTHTSLRERLRSGTSGVDTTYRSADLTDIETARRVLFNKHGAAYTPSSIKLARAGAAMFDPRPLRSPNSSPKPQTMCVCSSDTRELRYLPNSVLA